MNKIIKDQISLLKPSATLAINEESNRLQAAGKKIYKFGFGQSPFPVPEKIVLNYLDLLKLPNFLFLHVQCIV